MFDLQPNLVPGPTDLEPFKAAADIAKTLITASTAILGLSITFSKEAISSSRSRAASKLLGASWVCYVLTITSGLLLLMNLTGRMQFVVSMSQKVFEDARQMGGTGGTTGIYFGSLTKIAIAHVGLFGAATVCLALSGALAYFAGPKRLTFSTVLARNCYLAAYARSNVLGSLSGDTATLDESQFTVLALAAALGHRDARAGSSPMATEDLVKALKDSEPVAFEDDAQQTTRPGWLARLCTWIRASARPTD